MTRARRTIVRIAAVGILLMASALVFAPYLPARITTLLLVAAIAILTFALSIGPHSR
jgi:hypothetical protein